MPRHPLCALTYLTKKFSASSVKVALPFTMQLSKNKRTIQGPKSIKVSGYPVLARYSTLYRRLPVPLSASLTQPSLAVRAKLVGVAGIEPATSALSGLRSNRLSYTPEALPFA